MYSLTRQLTKFLLNSGKQLTPATITTATMSSGKKYETLSVTVPKPFVYHVELNRPDKLNTFNHSMWLDIEQCFNDMSNDENCRSVVLSAAGRLFTAGIDLNSMMSMGQQLAEVDDIARKAKIISSNLRKYQDSMSSLEKCIKPVIVAVHGACIGAGVNMITAADIRYCSNDAWFQVKEVDIGMAADVGSLQRLPKIIGSDSLARELCYTARKMHAPEALSCGFVSKVFENKESLINGAVELAAEIAGKSPVAVQGTKMNLVYSRDHTVQEGLDQIANHNKSMLQSEDFINAVMGQATKNPATQFSKL